MGQNFHFLLFETSAVWEFPIYIYYLGTEDDQNEYSFTCEKAILLSIILQRRRRKNEPSECGSTNDFLSLIPEQTK